ncbi:hypothetical protein COL21_22430 [Bacillus thuringiensis]|uniref:hypothetical protein n=1 Tax=Bacillus thuringiensis TaxID=1428 RepID=UPI000BF85560|nr:hypothetical protein [Bacillus thuringiensis]PFV91007.1 hypothetical protein COL21_22430 [Bacillus thuringiensis]PGR86619.1 hypothetical protein COC68_32185 [Bacillus thuringiensis]
MPGNYVPGLRVYAAALNYLLGAFFYLRSTKYDKIVVTEFVMLAVNITFGGYEDEGIQGL